MVNELAHQVALGDVRGLVSHHSRKFILVAGRQDQAAVYGNETARHRKGIDDRILQHEVVKLVLAFLGMARQAVADLLNIIADLGIFDNLTRRTDLAEPSESRSVFIVERHRGRRGASQIRQVLIDGATHAGGPAKTDARAGRSSRRKHREGLQQ